MFDSDFANLWDNAETSKSNNFAALPDGNYTCKVNSVRFEKSKSDKTMIVWDLSVTEGDYSGRHIFNNQSVSSAKSIGFAKGQFARLGFDCSSFENVHLAFEQLLDCIVAVSLKTRPAKGQYEAIQNVYVNSIISKPDERSGAIDPSLWK